MKSLAIVLNSPALVACRGGVGIGGEGTRKNSVVVTDVASKGLIDRSLADHMQHNEFGSKSATVNKLICV